MVQSLFSLSLSRISLQKRFEYNFIDGTICRLTKNIISEVSKSAEIKNQDKRIGRGRKLSRYQMV